jgi:Rhs element Vgr protein
MGVVTATIIHDGEVADAGMELLSIDIRREYNRIPYAEIIYIDGDPATQKFPVTENPSFEVGKPVVIKLKYEGSASGEKTVFSGVIIKKGLQLTQDGCILTLEISDTAVKMTGVRKNKSFSNMKDSEAITAILRKQGVEGTVETTQAAHGQLVQYYATDWDFMMSRAEANGMLVLVNDGKIQVAKPPALTGPEDYKITYGVDEIYSFDLEVDSRYEAKTVKSSAWDVKTQAMTEPVSGVDSLKLTQAPLNAVTMQKPLGDSEVELSSGISLADNEAKAWADARILKDRLSVLKGNIQIKGTSVELGKIVSLVGMSTHFSGNTLITGIRHEVSSGGWSTYLQFGLSADWFSAKYPVADTPAAGLLPGVNGLQIGVVEAFEEDPGKEFRIKVRIPTFGAENNTVWARLSATDAGKNRGMFFMPEAKDEVILGFLNDDPRQAIILGSVYSSANTAPLVPEAENPQKGLVTIGGHKLLFDDKKKTITLSTSDDQHVIIDEEKKSILLKDKNNNSIELGEAGITLTSAKDVIIKSDGDVKIDAAGKVEIKGSEVDTI